jgi:hypothetical protein
MAFLAAAAPALAIVGTAVSAAGAIYGGLAASASAKANANAAAYQAQVAAQNSIIANKNAAYAVAAGAQTATQQDLATRALIGNEEAAQASTNLDVNSGSAVKVRASSAALGNLSHMNIVNNAARESYGFRVQGLGYTSQSALDTMQSGLDKQQATGAIVGGIASAVGDVATGAAKYGSLTQQLQNSGAIQSPTAGTPNLATGGIDAPVQAYAAAQIPHSLVE